MAAHALITADSAAAIDKWVAKYPSDQKQSAVIEALKIVQEQNGGWLTNDLMDAVADYLDMPKISVYEVASFYSMFEHKPIGRHKISVCTNISCLLCGSEDVVQHLERRLGIRMGQTTPDQRYTLKEVECLGACVGAPMFLIGRTYYEYLTPDRIDQILDSLD
jgi:NADH-quinone oxidoreductase subunit E